MPSGIPDKTFLNTHTTWSQGLKYLFSSESAIITTTSKTHCTLHSTFYTLKKNWRQQLTYQNREKKEELNKTYQKKERPSGTKRYWENRIEEVFLVVISGRVCHGELISVCGNVRAYMGVKLMCYQEMCMCVWACMPWRVWGDVSMCIHIWVSNRVWCMNSLHSLTSGGCCGGLAFGFSFIFTPGLVWSNSGLSNNSLLGQTRKFWRA